MALRSSLTLTGAIIMMLITSLKLTAIIVATVPAVLLPILIFGRRVRKLSTSSQDSVASVGSYAGEIIHNIRTVQGFNRQQAEAQAFDREVEAAFDIARRRIRQRALLVAAAIMVLLGGLTGMIYGGGQDVISGAMTGGELAAFMFYATMVGTGFATLSEVWGDLQRAAGATERLLELIEAPSDLVDGDTVAELSQSPPLQLIDVRFAYPTRPDIYALDGLSLSIEPRRSLALVGPSGAGKSTLFELLQRFYDPQAGRIELDGVNIRDMPLAQLRSELAVVPQQPTLFSASVRYNIAYGRFDASDAEIEEAARRAHAHDFICELPEGYDSDLGELGVRLSGGQRQRIALARAMLMDPKILLLDEATSALDAESEHQVQQAIAELMHERTTIIIAHRLATIRDVDRIAVMDKGRVIATGTHEELQQNSPLYARLAKLQFRDGASAD
jgi:ATP-binding cassette subfamily B protein